MSAETMPLRDRDPKTGRLVCMDAYKRFVSKVRKDWNGCWMWTGSKLIGKGVVYGQFWLDGRLKTAHRASWELHNKASIPTGKQVDHLCNVGLCVNPEHLRVATPWENNSRSNSACAKNARKLKCPKGHFYSDLNTKRATGGKRCRTCANDQQRASRATAIRGGE